MSWPKFIPSPSGNAALRGEWADDCHAVRLTPDQPPPAAALFVLAEEDIAVLPGAAASEKADLAVYRLTPGGALGVATGRVYIRFAEATRAETSRAALAQAGYVIESIPAWAPHTCWLTADSGLPADALSRLDALFALPQGVAVEPEILFPRQRKGTPG